MGKYKEDHKKNKLSPAAWILLFSLVVSIGSLIIYLEESGFTDETLFLLLMIIRYSSFLVCICAIYKLLVNICRIFLYRTINFVSIFLYLLAFIYGIGIFVLEALIVVFARGNI